jgi:hypothetical protein
VPPGVPTSGDADVSLEIPPTRLTASGCASPNALVSFFLNDVPVGTVVASSNGQFTKTINSQTYGLHNLRAYYQDANSRTSSTVTENISLTSHSNTILNMLLPTTVEHEPEPVKVGNYLIFRGSTCPFALTNVTINNNFTLAAQADNKGNWYVIADTENFISGKYSYDAVSSMGTQTSQKTQKYLFTAYGGANVGDSSPALLSQPVITDPADGYLSSSRSVTVRGTGPTNSQIEVYLDNRLSGSIFANSYGEWTFITTLSKNKQNFSVRACNQGTCSNFSNQITISYIGDLTICNLGSRLADYRYYGIQPDEGIDIGLSILAGNPRYEVLIDWGDASVEHITKLDDEKVRYHHIYKDTGQYNGVVTIEDSLGCVQYQYFTVAVGQDDSTAWWLLAFIPLGGALSVAVSRYITSDRLLKPSSLRSMLPGLQQYPRPVIGAEHKPEDEVEIRRQ